MTMRSWRALIDGRWGGDSSRQAASPAEIAAMGWLDIAWRVWRGFIDDSLLMVARSIAFSFVMALFPVMAAFLALYGLFADPAAARDHLRLLTGVIPGPALQLISDEMLRIAAQARAGLSATFLGGLALAIWTANTGMRALIRGLNICYSEGERRSVVGLNRLSLTLAVCALGFALAAAAGLLAAPWMLDLLGASIVRPWLHLLRWPALFVAALGAFVILYRYGPCRRPARWRWLVPGAAAAALLWLIGSWLLGLFVGIFIDISAAYGSLGALFAFMSWVWASASAVLFGAKLNAEIEHQTYVDSTVGPERPMGERGAAMADTKAVRAGDRGHRWRDHRAGSGK